LILVQIQWNKLSAAATNQDVGYARIEGLIPIAKYVAALTHAADRRAVRRFTAPR